MSDYMAQKMDQKIEGAQLTYAEMERNSMRYRAMRALAMISAPMQERVLCSIKGFDAYSSKITAPDFDAFADELIAALESIGVPL